MGNSMQAQKALATTVFIFIFLTGTRGHGEAPVVETTLGTVIGSTITVDETTVYQFLGVPYARPPTGRSRFKKPEAVEAWSEPLLATTEPPACVQYTANPFPWYDDQPGKSEDCLFLNVWVPPNASPNNKKTVMYWIFGGGFFMGSIRQPMYQGDYLSANGDIIVVTVSYRLGSLGFLFSGSEDAPGNVGLWDILTGLKWVNDNIESFGGDTSRITIAGVSAGSIAVGLLSVSPLARGLFSRMIMQSGSPAYIFADDNQKSMMRSQKIAEIVGCADANITIENSPAEVVDCLLAVDANDLIAAESSLIPHSSRSFLPRYGDEILPKNPRLAILDNEFQNGDLLTGNCQDEGSFQLTTSNPDLFGFFGEKDPHINISMAEKMLRRMFSKYNISDEAVRHFFPDNTTEDTIFLKQQLYTASGDFSLLCPTVFFAEKMAEANNSVYFYNWNHRPTNIPWAEWMGVPHLSEVQFLFGLPLKISRAYSEDEVHLSKDMIQKWANFVKRGVPEENWPLCSKEEKIYLNYGAKEERNGTGPQQSNCDFFRTLSGF